MMGNLTNCTSGASGGLIAFGVQSMGMRRELVPWRWLFIIDFYFTIIIDGIGLCIPQLAGIATPRRVSQSRL